VGPWDVASRSGAQGVHVKRLGDHGHGCNCKRDIGAENWSVALGSRAESLKPQWLGRGFSGQRLTA
jgi:hypothetical protein